MRCTMSYSRIGIELNARPWPMVPGSEQRFFGFGTSGRRKVCSIESKRGCGFRCSCETLKTLEIVWGLVELTVMRVGSDTTDAHAFRSESRRMSRRAHGVAKNMKRLRISSTREFRARAAGIMRQNVRWYLFQGLCNDNYHADRSTDLD